MFLECINDLTLAKYGTKTGKIDTSQSFDRYALDGASRP